MSAKFSSKENADNSPSSRPLTPLANRIVLCAIYYLAWIYLLPRLQHYRVRPEIVSLDNDDSATTHRLVKVPLDELAAWDSTHDTSGRRRRRVVGDGDRDVIKDGVWEERVEGRRGSSDDDVKV